MRLVLFWVLAPCRLIGRCHCVRQTYYLHLQGWSGLPFLWSYINPSASHHCHFSSEDGDTMFLQNVGIYPRVRMVPKPRRTSSTSLPWKPEILHICETLLLFHTWLKKYMYMMEKSRKLNRKQYFSWYSMLTFGSGQINKTKGRVGFRVAT